MIDQIHLTMPAIIYIYIYICMLSSKTLGTNVLEFQFVIC